MTPCCSLCGKPALHPFAIGDINGHVCADHHKQWVKLAEKFVVSALREQRRKLRELEAELIPRGLRRAS